MQGDVVDEEQEGEEVDPLAAALDDECVASVVTQLQLAPDACPRRLTSHEDKLFGPPASRDVAGALAGLRRLAAAVPAQQAAVPSAAPAALHTVSVQPHVAAGGDALFVIAALAFTGVLPPEDMPWHPAWADSTMRQLASIGNLEASLAVGSTLVHGRGEDVRPNCEAGLPFLRAAADEVLRRAEGSADHTVPQEPVRLRERVRDGAWAARVAEGSDPQLRMEEDLAARGVPEAQRHMGYRRLLGRGVPADEAAAAAAFEAAAANGDEFAMFNRGLMHMRAGNYTQASALFQKAADKNLPAAFNGIGVLAFNGWGTPRNLTAARLAFEEGAARGDPDAHYNRGMLYSSGAGVAADAALALTSFEAASEAGHWRAPHTLAGMHAEGTGTTVNCSRAARLASLFVEERLDYSAEVDEALDAYDAGDVQGALVRLSLLTSQGCEAAASNAAFMLRAGKAPWLTPAQASERAAALLAFAVARGAADASVDLGDMALSSGNVTLARQHYAAAADAGLSEGMFALGLLHLRGHTAGGSARNLTAAEELFSAAWDAAPTEEATIPPALALAAVRALVLRDRAATALAAAVSWTHAENVTLAALSLAVAVVLHWRAQLRMPQAAPAGAGPPQPPRPQQQQQQQGAPGDTEPADAHEE